MINRMVPIIAIGAFAVMALICTGCPGDEDPPHDDTATQTDVEPDDVESDEDAHSEVGSDGDDGVDGDDGADGDDGVDGDDGADGDDEADGEVVTPPGFVLRYRGRYEHQRECPFRGMRDYCPDHLMGCAVFDQDRLLVASSPGLAVVDLGALNAGTVVTPVCVDRSAREEAPNLQGATATVYFPKLFGLAVYGEFVYASTRYDGVAVYRIEDGSDGNCTGTTIGFLDLFRVEGEFSESVQVVGDFLFVAHHRDGVEVFSLAGDPEHPTSVDRLTDPLVDSWGITALPDGAVWIADGAGGVKVARFDDAAGTLTLVGGDDLDNSPGMVFDIAPSTRSMVAAVGGRGVATYDITNGELQSQLQLSGVCVDVAPMDGERVAVAFRSWVHVVEVSLEEAFSSSPRPSSSGAASPSSRTTAPARRMTTATSASRAIRAATWVCGAPGACAWIGSAGRSPPTSGRAWRSWATWST